MQAPQTSSWVGRIVAHVVAGLQSVSRALAALSALLTFGLVLATTADVISRNFAGQPIRGVFEYTEVMLVAIVFLGIPYTMQVSGHVTIDSFLERVPRRVGAIVTTLGLVAVSPFLVWWTVSSWHVATAAWRAGEARMGVMQVPVWPARFLVPLGTSLLLFELVVTIWSHVQEIKGGATDG